MDARRGFGRRDFLVGAGGLVVCGLAPGCRAEGGDPALLAALSGFYPDPQSAAAVGLAYLEGAPEERDPATLVARLCGDRCERWAGLAASEPEALFQELRLQHREDFERERVTSVEGWVLSRTEARLCALAAVSGAASRSSGPGAGPAPPG